MNNFSKEEIEAAKKTRSAIIQGDVSELKSIYMAGEICMWDELNNQPSPPEQGKEAIEFAEFMGSENLEYDGNGNWLKPDLIQHDDKSYSIVHVDPKPTSHFYKLFNPKWAEQADTPTLEAKK